MKFSFRSMIQVLAGRNVEFIIVGGIGATLQGAQVNTFDLDIVHARTPGNIERLLAALTDLDAVYRVQPEKKLRPSATHLAGPGHQLLLTRFGPLDVLGTIGNSRDYESLLPHTVEAVVGGAKVQLLNLETVIATKEEAGSEKDRAVLPLLRATLNEKRRS